VPAEFELLLRARFPLIWLDTPEEQRAVELACRVGRSMGDTVAAWSATWGVHEVPGAPVGGPHTDPTAFLAHVRKSERRCTWLLRDIGHLVRDNPTLERALRDTAHCARERGTVLVALGNGCRVPASLHGEAAVHRLALPEQSDHEALLRQVAKELDLRVADADVERLARACLGLTLEQAENTWARIRARGGRFTLADLPQVTAEKARIIRGSGFLEYMEPERLDAVGGLAGLKTWVRRRAVGFTPSARDLGLPWPRGMLLVGVQGCGKSLSAKAVAGEWSQPLLRMDVGALMEGYVGASERNLRTALALAERAAPCVLWVDEIEKGCGGVDGANDGGTTRRMFGSMLTWMQERESPVFLLATANDIEGLPSEMLRKGRFDEIFFVDLPDAAEREQIFRIHLGARATRARDPELAQRVDLRALVAASDGYSGAEIAAAVVEGAFAALASSEPLDGRHVGAALGASPPLSRTRAESIDRLREWARGRAREARA
jgi:hypothetical protein